GVRQRKTSPDCDKRLDPGCDPTRGDSMTALAGWANFYIIVGSSAGALIGLQFVVISLIADMPMARGDAAAGDALATPTIVHLGAALLLSGILSAPWDGIGTHRRSALGTSSGQAEALALTTPTSQPGCPMETFFRRQRRRT